MKENFSQTQTSPAAPNAEARALKILNERLWHFTSVGMGNCRAAQRVRREIEQHHSRSGTGASPGRSSIRSNETPPQNPLANQTLQQLTSGLSHLESVGLANSRAAEITRRELSRRLLIQSALIANANFNPNEPRDRLGRWTQQGNTAGSATSRPDQLVTNLIGAPPSEHGAKMTNDPNQYIKNVSDSFPSTLNAGTNNLGQTNNPSPTAPARNAAGLRELPGAPHFKNSGLWRIDPTATNRTIWGLLNTPLVPEPPPPSPEEQRKTAALDRAMLEGRIVSTPGGAMIVQDPGPGPLGPIAKPTIAAGILDSVGDLARGFTSPIGLATLGIGALRDEQAEPIQTCHFGPQ